MNFWTDLGFDNFNDKKLEFRSRIAGPVGNNMDNNDDDVRTSRTLFDTFFERPAQDRETDHEGRPLGMITRQMDDDIRKFQKDNDLKVDGYMRPGGETINGLTQKVAAKQRGPQPSAGMPSTAAPAQKPSTVPPQQELAVPAPPAYRKDVFKGGKRQEWEEFYRKVENRTDLGHEEKRIIQDIFAAEGGRDTHAGSSAFAGVLPSTLEKHIKQGKVPGIIAKHGDKAENTKLDADDLVEIYKSHLNDTMSSAIKGHNDRNPDDKVDAMKLLGKLDNKVGDTVADTLFKNGTGDGPKFVIKAINANLPKDQQLTGKPGIGSQTYQALQNIAADPKKTDAFLQSLSHIRSQEEKNGKNELDRIYQWLRR